MRKYTEEEKERLLKCDCINEVKDHKIVYDNEFKKYALKENQKGRNPMEIFISAGLPLEILGRSYPKDIFKNWRKCQKKQEEKAYKKIFDEKLLNHLKEFFENKDINVNYVKRLKNKPFKKLSSKELVHLTAYALEENNYLKKAFAIEIKKGEKKEKEKETETETEKKTE